MYSPFQEFVFNPYPQRVIEEGGVLSPKEYRRLPVKEVFVEIALNTPYSLQYMPPNSARNYMFVRMGLRNPFIIPFIHDEERGVYKNPKTLEYNIYPSKVELPHQYGDLELKVMEPLGFSKKEGPYSNNSLVNKTERYLQHMGELNFRLLLGFYSKPVQDIHRVLPIIPLAASVLFWLNQLGWSSLPVNAPMIVSSLLLNRAISELVEKISPKPVGRFIINTPELVLPEDLVYSLISPLYTNMNISGEMIDTNRVYGFFDISNGLVMEKRFPQNKVTTATPPVDLSGYSDRGFLPLSLEENFVGVGLSLGKGPYWGVVPSLPHGAVLFFKRGDKIDSLAELDRL